MRRSLVVITVIATAALAWLADRLLWEAQIRFGMYGGSDGTREALWLADRVPRLLLLLLLGVLLAEAWRGRLGLPIAAILLAAGALLSAVPLVGIGLAAQWALPVALEIFFPYFFVAWTATGLALIGLLGIIRGRAPLRPIPALPGWGRAALAAGLLALVIPLDALISDLFLDLALRRDAALPFTAIDVAARTSVLAALTALAILTLEGARDRIAGLTLVMIGMVAFVGLAVLAFLVEPQGAMTRGEGQVPVAGFAMRWLAGGIVLLGAWDLMRPVPQATPDLTVGPAPAD